MTTTTAPDYFVKHLSALSAALESAGWIREVEPGFWAADIDAPEELRRSYWGLVRMGYANGWLA